MRLFQLIIAIVACCALSSSSSVLKNTAWSHIELTRAGESLNIYGGLNSVYIEGSDAYEDVYDWDEFCGVAAGGLNTTDDSIS